MDEWTEGFLFPRPDHIGSPDPRSYPVTQPWRLAQPSETFSRRWRERPIDFWLQLSCSIFFALARGPYRALGVLLALLQWYQCGFHLYLIDRFMIKTHGLDFCVSLFTLVTSQALTFSFAIFYFWQTDFVPFQGCSLPYLCLPDLSGELSEEDEPADGHTDEDGGRNLGQSDQLIQSGWQVDGTHEVQEEGDQREVQPSQRQKPRAGVNRMNDPGVDERTALLQRSVNSSPPLSPGDHERCRLPESWLYSVNSRTGRLERRLCSQDEKTKFEDVHRDTCTKAHLFLGLGFAIITAIIILDFSRQRFFTGRHIRNFLLDCDGALTAMYFVCTISVYYGMYGIVTVCCPFYCATRSMVLAIMEAEQRTILPEVPLESAINIQEHLMQFIRNLTGSMSLWFAVHNISFLVLVLASAFWWRYMGVTEKDPRPALLFSSVSLACLAIVFKFLFPLWATTTQNKNKDHKGTRTPQLIGATLLEDFNIM